MAIFYIDQQPIIEYPEDIQSLIDAGFSLPSTNSNFFAKNNTIFNIIDPQVYQEIIGSSYDLFYTHPMKYWKSIPAQVIMSTDVTIKNNIILNAINNKCSIENYMSDNIENDGVAYVLTEYRVPTNILPHIFVIKSC